MKKLKLLVAILALGSLTTQVEAQSLKDKIFKPKGGGGSSNAFEALNQETDPMGITGQYTGLTDKKAYGLRFVKEADGKVVNQLHYFEKKMTPDPALKLYMKESYFTKNKVKLFYAWISTGAANYVEVLELEPGVFAQITQTNYSHSDAGVVALDADRKVKDVYAKDPAKLSVYDIETAQAKVDQIITSLNAEKLEKDRAEWLKFDVYKNNVNKVVFSDKWYNLQKQGYANKIGVDGKAFKTELDMGGDMAFMAFFTYPPSVKYAGQQINIEYEMEGKKVNREECRKRSASWSSMVKLLETKDFNYHQSSTRAIREYNAYHSQFVQDYAAIQLLYLNKDKLKVGQSYNFTVRFYAHRDGENGDLLAEGVVKLKYTDAAKKAFDGDPAKPEMKSVFAHFEKFLDE
jgi:hypothetical protein